MRNGRKALTEDIDGLRRKQESLIKQVEDLEPSGNPDLDAAWRRGLQNRFAALVTEQQAKEELLDRLHQQTRAPDVDLTILERVPITDIDPQLLPEDLQRELYDAFRLQLHYHPVNEQVVVHVAVTAEIGRLINTGLR